ncbi:MAG: hypothetical protein ABEH78_00700 [Haloferacaceae archaeon]
MPAPIGQAVEERLDPVHDHADAVGRVERVHHRRDERPGQPVPVGDPIRRLAVPFGDRLQRLVVPAFRERVE